MRRGYTLLAILLTTLWFSATQHCALEAAGIAPADCHGAAGTEPDSCSRDACGAAEKAQCRFTTAPGATAPARRILVSTIFVLPDMLRLVAASAPPAPGFERPTDWVSTWQFTRRAAPPSRAPTAPCA